MSETTAATLEQETQTAPTGPQSQAETAPVETNETADTSLAIEDGEAYLKNLSEGKDGKEEQAPAPVRRSSPLDDPKAGQYRETYKTRTQSRQSQIDASVEELVEHGIPETTARRIVNGHKDLLNAEHSDGIQLSGYTAAAEAAEQIYGGIEEGMKALDEPVLKRFQATVEANRAENKPTTWPDFFSRLQESAREGHVPTTGLDGAQVAAIARVGLKKFIVDTFNQGRDQRAAVGNSASSKPNGVTGSATSASNEPKDLAEAELMHAGMHPTKPKINNAEMRAYQARFGAAKG